MSVTPRAVLHKTDRVSLHQQGTQLRIASWRKLRWLWLIAFIGSLNFVFRTASDIEAGYLTIGVLHRVISLALIAIPVSGMALRRPRTLFKGIPGLLVLFSLWRLLSTFWSIAPEWTLYRSIEYLYIVILLAYTVTALDSWKDARVWLNWVWGWQGILVLSAWIGVVFFPEEALVRWPGAFLPGLTGVVPRLNPNGLAQMGAILALVGISRRLSGEKRAIWLLSATLGIVTLIFAQGRAAIIGFLLGLFLLLLLHRKLKILWSLSTVTAIGALWGRERAWGYFWEYLVRGQSEQVFLGFSSRTQWWELVWEYLIKSKFMLGSGAFAGGRIVAPLLVGVIVGQSSRITLDNTWLELMADVGVIGAVPFLLVLIWVVQVLISRVVKGRSPSRFLAIECLSILVLLVVRSFFVSSLAWHNAFPFLAVVGYTEFLRQERIEKRFI